MIYEGMAFVAGSFGSVVPDHGWNSIGLRQLSIVFKIILLEGLLAHCRTVHTTELAQIYRDALIDAGVRLPLFWPEVIETTDAATTENRLARTLLPLPIDQRYTERDMEQLVKWIL